MKGKRLSLEMIINEVKEKTHTETKTLNGIFIDIIQSMGVSSISLKNDTKRYNFSQQGYDFWIDVLSNYTSPPYSHVRSKDYDKLPLYFIDEFMEMVKETMHNANKSDVEIQRVLQKIDDTVDYSNRRGQEALWGTFKIFFERYKNTILSRSFLRLEDRLCISKYVDQEWLSKHLECIYQNAVSLIEYFEDERLSEAQDASIDTDAEFADKILSSDYYADVMFDTDAKVLSEVEKISGMAEASTKGEISRQSHSIEKITKKQWEHQKAADVKLGVSVSQRRSYISTRHRSSEEILQEAIEELTL